MTLTLKSFQVSFKQISIGPAINHVLILIDYDIFSEVYQTLC